MLKRSGIITGLEIHPVFQLSVNGKKIGKIIPDFMYYEAGVRVVEDVKSPITITKLFKWKAKHLEAEHGITIRLYM